MCSFKITPLLCGSKTKIDIFLRYVNFFTVSDVTCDARCEAIIVTITYDGAKSLGLAL